MLIRRRGRGGTVAREGESTSSSEKKTEEKKTGVMDKITHGIGTFIQGAVIASDKTLDFAQASKEKTAHGALVGNRKRYKDKDRDRDRREEERKRQKKEDKKKEAKKFLNNSHFDEEQRKELTIFLEEFASNEDEYQDLTDEQDDDDGYFGITDPGLTAPTVSTGLRNSFGDFFGHSADAIESHLKK